MSKAAKVALLTLAVGAVAYAWLEEDEGGRRAGDRLASLARLAAEGARATPPALLQPPEPERAAPMATALSARAAPRAAASEAIATPREAIVVAQAGRDERPPTRQGAGGGTTERAAEPPARAFTVAKPRDEEARRQLTRLIQRELKRVGCLESEADGSWSQVTRRAMAQFTDRINATLPIEEPDYILLTLLQGHTERACGASCPAGQLLDRDGRCQPRSVVAQSERRQVPRTGSGEQAALRGDRGVGADGDRRAPFPDRMAAGAPLPAAPPPQIDEARVRQEAAAEEARRKQQFVLDQRKARLEAEREAQARVAEDRRLKAQAAAEEARSKRQLALAQEKATLQARLEAERQTKARAAEEQREKARLAAEEARRRQQLALEQQRTREETRLEAERQAKARLAEEQRQRAEALAEEMRRRELAVSEQLRAREQAQARSAEEEQRARAQAAIEDFRRKQQAAAEQQRQAAERQARARLEAAPPALRRDEFVSSEARRLLLAQEAARTAFGPQVSDISRAPAPSAPTASPAWAAPVIVGPSERPLPLAPPADLAAAPPPTEDATAPGAVATAPPVPGKAPLAPRDARRGQAASLAQRGFPPPYYVGRTFAPAVPVARSGGGLPGLGSSSHSPIMRELNRSAP